MHYLVTGGAGFIGLSIVEQWVWQGERGMEAVL
jgi:dTDP-D-glucose 4,6-dehydratase